MEYQINFDASFSYDKDFFNHIKRQLLTMGDVFSSLRVDVYLFPPDRQIFHRINIYFHRLRDFGSDTLIHLFSKAYANYISYPHYDRYELDEKSHNISFRLHFIKIPVKTATLEMQPFTYYERVNIAYSLMSSKKKTVVVATQAKKKRKDLSASLAKQTLVSGSYSKEDFDFIF